ncbi:MAG: hypothetical protein ACE5EK_05215, partial [Nitrospinales bacterium]
MKFACDGEGFIFSTSLGLVIVSYGTLLVALLGGIYPLTLWTFLIIIYLFSLGTLRSLGCRLLGGLRSFLQQGLTDYLRPRFES